MLKRAGFRRTSFLVNRKIQLRFLGLLALQMGVVLTALVLLVRSHLARISEIAATVPNFGSGNREQLQIELIEASRAFGMRSVVMLVATAVVILTLGMLASHRLAGPTIKLQNFLHRISDGIYSQRIAFRGSDHLDFFAEQINRTMESIERRQFRAGQIAQALCRKGDDLANGTGRKATLAEMTSLVAELKAAI